MPRALLSTVSVCLDIQGPELPSKIVTLHVREIGA